MTDLQIEEIKRKFSSKDVTVVDFNIFVIGTFSVASEKPGVGKRPKVTPILLPLDGIIEGVVADDDDSTWPAYGGFILSLRKEVYYASIMVSILQPCPVYVSWIGRSKPKSDNREYNIFFHDYNNAATPLFERIAFCVAITE